MGKILLVFLILMLFSCGTSDSSLADKNQFSEIDTVDNYPKHDSIDIIELEKLDSVSEAISLIREIKIVDKTRSTQATLISEKDEPNHFNEMLFSSGGGSSSGNSSFGDGFGDGFGMGTGEGVGSGVGPGFGNSGAVNETNLNRKVIDFGGIADVSKEDGKVALNIWVNENGRVVKVKYKPSHSNTSSAHLIGLAKKWAYTMTYEKLEDTPIQFVGYQIFNFKGVTEE